MAAYTGGRRLVGSIIQLRGENGKVYPYKIELRDRRYTLIPLTPWERLKLWFAS